MPKYHVRFDPKNLPSNIRKDSLYRAAVYINQDAELAVVFTEDSLKFLNEIECALLHQGIWMRAQKFLAQLALDTISGSQSIEAKELLELRRRKWEAVETSHLRLAAELYQRQREIQNRLTLDGRLQISREHILEALARDGITLPLGNGV